MKKLNPLLYMVILVTVVFVIGFLIQSYDPILDEVSVRDEVSIVITNQGSDLEGHTPRGFQGMGTGLFAGDNLNPNFPDGDGVQMFLTFDLSSLESNDIESAVLFSQDVHISGTPFTDLGNLIVESVSFNEFSSALWNKEVDEQICVLTAITDIFTCDISRFISGAVNADIDKVQFRFRFERPSDNDGQPDMILFYKTNSNTNEPGIFKILINSTIE